MEAFQVYPGARFHNALKERLAGGDALGTAPRVLRVASESRESAAKPRRAAGHDARRRHLRAAFYMADDHDGCEHVLDVKEIHGYDANPGLKH